MNHTELANLESRWWE